jgi:anti-sigma factor RsiW
MSCDHYRSQLEDFLDGELAADERRRLEEHLHDCLPCRRELEGLAELLAAARRLPAATPPPRDLWPGIAGRLEARRGASVLSFPPSRWRRPVQLAVAAAALLAAVALALWTLRPAPAPAPGEAADPGRTAAVATAALSDPALPADSLAELREEVHATLERRRSRLSPETVAVVEQNLSTIDRAIADIRSALDEDPSNQQLHHLLAAQYRREVELLHQLSRL